MSLITLSHPSLGKRNVQTVFTPPERDRSNVIVLSASVGAKELKEGEGFYKQYANKISFYPDWEVTLNDDVKIIKRSA